VPSAALLCVATWVVQIAKASANSLRSGLARSVPSGRRCNRLRGRANVGPLGAIFGDFAIGQPGSETAQTFDREGATRREANQAINGGGVPRVFERARQFNSYPIAFCGKMERPST